MENEKFVSVSQAGSKKCLQTTTAPVVSNGANDHELEAQLDRLLGRIPAIITLPKPKQKCPYTGQSRTALLEMVAPSEKNGGKPPVRASYRRSHKHATRGRWLIPAENLFRYILSLESESVAAYSELAAERKKAKAE